APFPRSFNRLFGGHAMDRLEHVRAAREQLRLARAALPHDYEEAADRLGAADVMLGWVLPAERRGGRSRVCGGGPGGGCGGGGGRGPGTRPVSAAPTPAPASRPCSTPTARPR